VKIAVTCLGPPRAPDSWSGTPASLVGALERLGHSVVAVDARMAWGSDRFVRRVLGLKMLASPTEPHTFASAQAGAAVSSQMGLMRSLSLLRHTSSLAHLDGVVQLGSDYLLPRTAVPYVTYEDMTVPQAARAGYPVWSTLPPDLLRRRINLQARVYGRAHACCFMTHWAASSSVDDYGVSASKVRVVGVGANHIVTVRDRDWYPPRFLFVGKDWQRKNGDAVVAAFSRLRQKHGNARLDLVGGVPPISADGVTVHGMLPLGDPRGRQIVERLFREATCFVMPSLHEPSALAYLEASHAGLPSIVSTAGGSQELVGSGGIGVAPNDAPALLGAMMALSDPAVASAMGDKAHQHVRLYTWDAVAQRVVRALKPTRAVAHNAAEFL
jgi:glycosyltransferase involved in cell wall biosynthesis